MNNLGKECYPKLHRSFDEWRKFAVKNKDRLAKDHVMVPYHEHVEFLIEALLINRTLTEEEKVKVVEKQIIYEQKCLDGTDAVSLRLAEILKKARPDQGLGFAHITLGYDENTITIPGMKLIAKAIEQMCHWKSCVYVHEKHTSNGIHHHTHFLVEFDRNQITPSGRKKSYAKKKIIQYIFENKQVKKFIKEDRFIQVDTKDGRTYESRLKYIMGDKCAEKMGFVELDKNWRIENNL